MFYRLSLEKRFSPQRHLYIDIQRTTIIHVISSIIIIISVIIIYLVPIKVLLLMMYLEPKKGERPQKCKRMLLL